MLQENWKTVIHSEDSMRDAIMYFMDDYLRLVSFWQKNESYVDDATWVHVDEVIEERNILEDTIAQLTHENTELKTEIEDFRIECLNLLKEIELLKSNKKEEPSTTTKRLVKRKPSRLRANKED